MAKQRDARSYFQCLNKSTRRPDALNVHISGQFRVEVPIYWMNALRGDVMLDSSPTKTWSFGYRAVSPAILDQNGLMLNQTNREGQNHIWCNYVHSASTRKSWLTTSCMISMRFQKQDSQVADW